MKINSNKCVLCGKCNSVCQWAQSTEIIVARSISGYAKARGKSACRADPASWDTQLERAKTNIGDRTNYKRRRCEGDADGGCDPMTNTLQ
jgi:MinD superfamily P-loop ATPase